MKSPLEQISELDVILRELHKIDSKLLSGQVIYAHRDIGRLVAILDKYKTDIIKEEKVTRGEPSEV